uniref:Glycosyltransferase 2-like domain-containing protein n=1 Tax=Oncorhynchus tshawytscha TaxID=74940 RepID=A0AAZ3PRV4_ONCTS
MHARCVCIVTGPMLISSPPVGHAKNQAVSRCVCIVTDPMLISSPPVGHAKNQAVSQSSGKYLCFQDADDVMMPQRIHLQYEACLFNSTSLIGCQVRRDPEGSTERYTRWINNISQDQLSTQVTHTQCVCVCVWGGSRARQ